MAAEALNIYKPQLSVSLSPSLSIYFPSLSLFLSFSLSLFLSFSLSLFLSFSPSPLSLSPALLSLSFSCSSFFLFLLSLLVPIRSEPVPNPSAPVSETKVAFSPPEKPKPAKGHSCFAASIPPPQFSHTQSSFVRQKTPSTSARNSEVPSKLALTQDTSTGQGKGYARTALNVPGRLEPVLPIKTCPTVTHRDLYLIISASDPAMQEHVLMLACSVHDGRGLARWHSFYVKVSGVLMPCSKCPNLTACGEPLSWDRDSFSHYSLNPQFLNQETFQFSFMGAGRSSWSNKYEGIPAKT